MSKAAFMTLQYNEDGTVLLSAELEADESSVVVAEGCRIIARKAFMYQSSLKHIVLPSTLEVLEDFALSCTALTEVEFPPSLKSVGLKAFYQCKELSRVELNEGLQKIGSEAFAHTLVSEIRLPATVRFIGLAAWYNTPLSKEQGLPGFSIAKENPFYLRDVAGGLYRNTYAGKLFCQMLSHELLDHTVEEGTKFLAQSAYYRTESLREVALPEGLRVIGKRAFDRVYTLEKVAIPNSLERIDDFAFRETSLKSLRVPRSLRSIGQSALFTGKKGASTLTSVSVDKENPMFFTEGGFLIQRQPWGSGHGICCYSEADIIRVPRSIQTIGSYCIASTRTIKSFNLHKGLTRIHPLAVAPHCRIENIEVELARPLCGSTMAHIPLLDKKMFFSPTYSLFPTGTVNIHYLFDESDHITYMSHKLFERAQAMLERLACPQYLSDKYRELFWEALIRKTKEICVEFAQHNYLKGFDRLQEFGFIDRTNIEGIIERVREVGDVVVTSYLLELRRMNYSHSSIEDDFVL